MNKRKEKIFIASMIAFLGLLFLPFRITLFGIDPSSKMSLVHLAMYSKGYIFYIILASLVIISALILIFYNGFYKYIMWINAILFILALIVLIDEIITLKKNALYFSSPISYSIGIALPLYMAGLVYIIYQCYQIRQDIKYNTLESEC